MTSLAERFSREIERVTILREQYRALEDGRDTATSPRAYWPAINLMTAAIEAAHQAFGANDANEQTKLLRTLEDFTDDHFTEAGCGPAGNHYRACGAVQRQRAGCR